ncbi:MAG: sigma-70 family RNA polymerase sigma factor [Planctomycetota bacterium]
MSEPTRVTLLERVRATQTGDSWNEFARVYDALIVGWLRQQGVADADADDVRQEVMQTVVTEIGRFDHNGRRGAFRRWLRQITANRLHRLWRSRSRKPQPGSGVDLGELADQLEDDRSRMTLRWDAAHDKFVLEELLAALESRFSAKSLTAFRRLAIGEEPVADVAGDLGMTIGAARVAQHRVLRALRELGAGLIDA